MAGAGFGVAVAGASGNSSQYTKGAKPYNGLSAAGKGDVVSPHNITVGTTTYPSTDTADITTPYVVTQPYAVYHTNPADAAAIAAYQKALGAEVTALQASQAAVTTLLKSDMRNLLEPTGNYLKTATLAKAKSISLKFTSPGSGKIAVVWKVGFPGKKGVFYVNYGGSLKKTGDIVVKLPTTAAGRKALAAGTKKAANVIATVTYTATGGNAIKVTRSYKTKG